MDRLHVLAIGYWWSFLSFLPRMACHRGTPRTTLTCTKLAENLWNTFERLRATWISVELCSLLVARRQRFQKLVVKMLTIFEARNLKKFNTTKKFQCHHYLLHLGSRSPYLVCHPLTQCTIDSSSSYQYG